LIENAAPAVPPIGTVTSCGFPVVTEQLPATSESVTTAAPGGTSVNSTLPLVAIDWLSSRTSTVTLYPSGSRSEPIVDVVTPRLPVSKPSWCAGPDDPRMGAAESRQAAPASPASVRVIMSFAVARPTVVPPQVPH